MQGVTKDARIKQEEGQGQMQESVQHLNRMIQKLPTGCAVLKGSGHWRLISGNEEFYRGIGYQLEIASVLGMLACVHFLSQHWDPTSLRPLPALCMLP